MSISRRGAMLGATAAAVVTGATTAPLAIKAALAGAPPPAVQADEPLLAMEQEWLAFCNYYDGLDEPDEVLDPLFDRLLDLQYRLLLTEAKSLAGVAVKLRVHCRNNCWAEDDFVDPRPEDVGRGGGSLEVLPLKSALRDLERLSGGLTS